MHICICICYQWRISNFDIVVVVKPSSIDCFLEIQVRSKVIISSSLMLKVIVCRTSYSLFENPVVFTCKRMSEAPFRPREKLLEKQKYFQSIHKHTYLKGPLDKITSVAIPAALAASSIFLIARGIYNMSHGIGKKE
ncbi:uncharacterized protein LOC130767309 isoform X1 [Actinidia eriantha]|nr:uncharacterized protein LOC130767309 isoform X1 [Actinidia eriantha]